ncbi:uncharacterized protein LOC133302145 [Gastrolobium bilobum]|uniref:uncharacterized protein LOC133302145 n=1 Tax=Gastrolobium bilobum TaxID=150636 RepID=UPI002AB2C1ED|nr:uncharacterized protein LOC133302145 [Gastrolobium bilobum]
MLMRETFDLNSMQSYAVPLKEGLRKTMLDQEVMFRKQVQELHRLYSMQKILMEDIGLKKFDRCNQSTWLFYSSNPVTHGSSASLIEDAKLSSTEMVCPTFTKSQMLPDRHYSVYNSIHPKPLGLQLCSDQRASHLDQEALNLSLSVVEEDRGIKATTSTCFDLKENSSTQNIIDLEVSTKGISNEEGNHATCTTTFVDVTKCESQISSLSVKMANSSCPFRNDGECPPGFQDCHEALMLDKSSLKDCISHEAGKLDLNQVQLADSSYFSSDNSVTCHFPASSFPVFGVSFDRTRENNRPCATQRKESSKSLYDASNILQWDDAVNSVLMNSNNTSEISDPKCKGIKGCEAGLTVNKSVFRTQVGQYNDLSYCISDPNNIYTGSIWKLYGGQFTDVDTTYVATKLVNCENTKNDEISCAGLSPPEEKFEDGNVLPALLCESSCIIDNSGSIKTKQPQINLGDTNLIAPDQHLGTGDGNEPGHNCPKKAELPEVSMCIQTAAQLLINLSLGSSSSHQDCSSKAESVKVSKEEMEKPDCSDSYEQIALKLEECSTVDCSVSSKPYEIDSTEKRDFVFKLRKGRRFKDFQKEILPGLVSLARHEIQEDINILEAILRSREYRKIRAGMGDQRSWCAPMRSRRSKRNNVRRKFF